MKKGFRIMNIEKRILAGLLGISIAAAGIEGVAIKMQNDEINNVKKHYIELLDDSYKQGLDDAFAQRSYDEDSKYVVLKTDRDNLAWDYREVADLMVVTDKDNEKILIDTKTHYFYEDIIGISDQESFEEYIANIYTKTNNESTKEFIRKIMSDSKQLIETINKDRLKELGIDKTSYDIFFIDYACIGPDGEILNTVTNIEAGKTYIYTPKK